MSSGAVNEALITSLSAAVEHAEPLLHSSSLEQVLRVARELPPVFASLGLEARLAEGDAQLDFGVCVARDQASRLGPVATGPCASFLARWLEDSGVLARSVPHAWFEFDVARGRAAPLTSAWDAAFPFVRLRDGACRADTIESLCTVLAALAEQSSLADARRLFEALPEEAYVFHLSALQHRGARELRVQFAAKTRGLLGWLAAWGVPAPRAGILHFVLEELPIRQVAVQLSSVNGELRAHSVELDFGHDAAQTPIWAALFDELQRADLASEQKLQALREWPGSSVLRATGAPALVRCTRTFHLTLKLGAKLEAKAYPYLSAGYALC